MKTKNTFKVLVTSQKGGVGKSSIAANLSAFICRQGNSVTLLDFDGHGSSSSWLTRAPNAGVVIQHKPLPLDQGGNRSLMDARLHLRRAAMSTDFVVSDLTWSSSIAGELMFEFDLVIVPTSISEIELAATANFLNHHRWVFDSAIHTSPLLLLSPTRVGPTQMGSEVFTKQRFPVKFILSPAILESQSARDIYEKGYLMDLQDECGHSFIDFGNAVLEAQRIGQAQQELIAKQRYELAMKRSVLDIPNSMSSRDLLLGRHRAHRTSEHMPKHRQLKPSHQMPVVTTSIMSRILSRFGANHITS